MAAMFSSNPHPPLPASHVASARHASEQRLGIHHHVSPIDFGWQGDIRKRYTDFLVNEVRKDGQVLHLTDFQQAPRSLGPTSQGTHPPNVNVNASVPARPQHSFSTSASFDSTTSNPSPNATEYTELPAPDLQALEELVGAPAASELCELDRKIQTKDRSVRGVTVSFPPITDRTQRTKVHQEIRRIFSSRIETQVGNLGVITAVAASGYKGHGGQGSHGSHGQGRSMHSNNWRGGHRSEPRAHRGEYLHFTLYKENKDTMDAVNHIARMLKIKASNFGFAGTKDRRAATVQRISIWNKDIREVNSLNDKMSGIRVGDFSYQKKPMQLGQHGGNEFVIVLKNVTLARGNDYSLAHRLRAAEDCVQTALDSITRNGFLNYFGLQRFGTHAIGTQEVGMKILRDDFMGAVDAILHVEPELAAMSVSEGTNDGRFHRDEFDRARAIAVWKMSSNADAATRILPKKYGAEFNLIRHLGRQPNDFCGALLSITRGLRHLYIHAYQSYVWNYVASHRWAEYGNKVIKGDLVLVEPESAALLREQAPSHDMSEDRNQEEEEFYQQARILTEEDVASGRYTIFDIVLPVPGYDVIYPDNAIGDFYVEFMKQEENGGLNPYEMRRRQREFSLSGHYRKLLATFTATPKFAVRAYSDDEQQMHPTDRDLIEWRKKMFTHKTREASTMWNNFSQNAAAADAAIAEELRRKKSQSPADQNTETRINDAWIETGLDGGKRIKVNGKVKETSFISYASGSGDAQAQPQGEVKTEPQTQTPAGPPPLRTNLNFAPLALKPGLAGNIHGGSRGDGDVEMSNAGPQDVATVRGDENVDPAIKQEARRSSGPHAKELLTYLENHLKTAAGETSPVGSGPDPFVVPKTKAPAVATGPASTRPPLKLSPVATAFEPSGAAAIGGTEVEVTMHSPTAGSLPDAPAIKSSPVDGTNASVAALIAKHSPVEKGFEEPAVAAAGAAGAAGATGSSQSSPTDSNFSSAPKSPVVNIFENFEEYIDPRHPAVNLSRKLDAAAKPEDTKIAVILNFRLSSSNYATICIREMTGHVGNSGL